MAQKILKRVEQTGILLKGKKFLMVLDNAYEYLEIKDFFNAIPHIEFSDFTSNPLYEDVCKGVELFNNEGCEAIVAVGGGSTIDVAKCIKLYCKMDHTINYLKQETFDSLIPLIAIPTTAGTGSESTCHAVIYYAGTKQSISHPSILPDCAILDPSVLKTLPLYQKKCTMLDALCQGIESWWSLNSNDESKVYSKVAVETIMTNWQEYIEENTVKAAENIMVAANYSGRAINITATTAAHAMSYKLTSMYKLPHGHAVAICLPEVWEYMLNKMDEDNDNKDEKYLKGVFTEIAEYIDIKQFRELVNKLQMAYPISENREADLEILTKSINPERLKNNPITLNSEVLYKIYERIIK